MARKKVTRETTQLENIFFRPEDVKDFKYLDTDEVDFSDLEGDADSGTVIDGDEGKLQLPVLSEITIVEQIPFKDYTGKNLVTVIIEVEDFDTVKAWNVRLAKA